MDTVQAYDDETIAARILGECMHGDTELCHVDADRILIELLEKLGYTKTAAAWDEVPKWYA